MRYYRWKFPYLQYNIIITLPVQLSWHFTIIVKALTMLFTYIMALMATSEPQKNVINKILGLIFFFYRLV